MTQRELYLIQHIEKLQTTLRTIKPFLPNELSQNIVGSMIENSETVVKTARGEEELKHAS